MKHYRFYARTAWTVPEANTSSHALTEIDWQEIDAVNGNEVTAADGLLILVNNANADSGKTVTVTPQVSGTLRDGANTFTAEEKPFVVPIESSGVLGPFSANYRFAGKLQFDWTLNGGALAANVTIAVITVRT
jgi:hypothetical protein